MQSRLDEVVNHADIGLRVSGLGALGLGFRVSSLGDIGACIIRWFWSILH